MVRLPRRKPYGMRTSNVGAVTKRRVARGGPLPARSSRLVLDGFTGESRYPPGRGTEFAELSRSCRPAVGPAPDWIRGRRERGAHLPAAEGFEVLEGKKPGPGRCVNPPRAKAGVHGAASTSDGWIPAFAGKGCYSGCSQRDASFELDFSRRAVWPCVATRFRLHCVAGAVTAASTAFTRIGFGLCTTPSRSSFSF
jgi:hypothetical protein